MLRECWHRLVALLRRSTLDRELDDEIAAHVDMATAEQVARGVEPAEARRRALAARGSRHAAMAAHRDARGTPSLDGLLQDVRYALRSLRSNPGFACAAIAILTAGIGINTAVFTLTAGLFRGFALVKDNDSLLYLRTRDSASPDRMHGVSYPDFESWRTDTRSFTSMAACRDVVRVSVDDARGVPGTYWAVQISASTFGIVGRQPILGRDFTREDEIAGAPTVAILSYGLWTQRFDRDRDIVGRDVTINGATATIVGVMPEGFTFPNKQDLWLPLTRTNASNRRDARDDLMFVFGRLAPTATLATARAELDTIGNRLAGRYPETNADYLPVVARFDEFFHGNQLTVYRMMCGAVGLVLLIACANLANLLLARWLGRSHEMALRMALGAARWRLGRQMLIESLMLSAVGAVGGWLIAAWGVEWYVSIAFDQYHPLSSPTLYPWFDFRMDGRVLGYLVAISMATAVLFGLAPLGRLRALETCSALRHEERGVVGGRNRRHLSAALVAGQVALAIVLLSGAGVLVRTMMNLYTADVGIEAAHVLSAYVPLRCAGPMCRDLNARYPTAESQAVAFERLREQLAAVPGVDSAAVASHPPAFGSWRRAYGTGARPVDGPRPPTVGTLAVNPTYFDTLGVPIVAGRTFTTSDSLLSTPVAIVNARFAHDEWPHTEAVGKYMRLDDDKGRPVWRLVVGVAPNLVQDFSRQATEPLVYIPERQQDIGALWLVVRTRVPPSSVRTAIEQIISDATPNVPRFDLRPLALALRTDYRYSYATLFLAFSGLAVALAAFGIHALAAHAVRQRTQEIGIRLAIGATRRHVATLALRQTLIPVASGVGLGLIAAWGTAPLIQSVLVGVSAQDPLTLAASSVFLIASALLGCLIPTRRAMRVDPMTALRRN